MTEAQFAHAPLYARRALKSRGICFCVAAAAHNTLSAPARRPTVRYYELSLMTAGDHPVPFGRMLVTTFGI